MWMILDYRGVLEIMGPNRYSFLQGLITQDVTLVTPNQPVYSLFLTNTGRFFCDFFLVEYKEALFLTPGVDSLEAFQKKLSFYKLRSDVNLRLRPDWQIAVTLEKNSWTPSEGLVFQDPRSLDLGKVFLGPSSLLTNITEDTYPYVAHRLSRGIPEGPLDLESEKSIPLENGMDELNAISWTKGCFLGQELTSRTKYVGEVRKKLLSFKGDAPVFNGNLVLQGQERQEVGRVVSVYPPGREGFALINTSLLQPHGQIYTENSTPLSLRLFAGRNQGSESRDGH